MHDIKSSDEFLNRYQEFCRSTDIYPKHDSMAMTLAPYLLGLNEEAGEAAGKLKKFMRGDRDWAETVKLIIYELGDQTWYIALVASLLGFTLQEVMEINMNKLRDRHSRDAIKGDGDTR